MSDMRNELLERWLESPELSDSPKGRPRTPASRLGQAFVAELSRSFEAHGKDTIEELRALKPDVYLRLVASFASDTMEPESGAFDDISDAELATLIMAARAALKVRDENGGGSEGAS
jgi:hypothetical protein